MRRITQDAVLALLRHRPFKRDFAPYLFCTADRTYFPIDLNNWYRIDQGAPCLVVWKEEGKSIQPLVSVTP